jgi:hypothetical protein
MIKLMPDALIPYDDVYMEIEDLLIQQEALIAKLGKQKYIRLMRHAAAFAENQFGKRVVGTSSYTRDDGDSISHCDVEIRILNVTYSQLGYHTSSCNDGETVKDCSLNAIPYNLKSMAM